MMNDLEHLKRWMQAVELPKTPAGQALALNLVTKMDLLRLKAVARLLDGSRKCPEGLSMVVFLAGIMRSLRAQYCRRARLIAARLPQIRIELDLDEGPDSEATDPTPDPERSLIAMQQLAEIDRLFADDPRAQQVIEGLFEGWS